MLQKKPSQNLLFQVMNIIFHSLAPHTKLLTFWTHPLPAARALTPPSCLRYGCDLHTHLGTVLPI